MKKSIAWSKWVDPMDELDELIKKNEDDIEEGDLLALKTKGFKIITTPHGIIPVTNNTKMSGKYEFWVGTTNFNITDSVVNILNEIPGIEILDVFTRYTFRIGLGRHPDFSFRSVRTKINELICNNNDSPYDKLLNNMDLIIDKIEEGKSWAVLGMPNGKVDAIISDNPTDDTFLKKLEDYKQIADGVGAILLTSNDLKG